jgi:hypothetical protein
MPVIEGLSRLIFGVDGVEELFWGVQGHEAVLLEPADVEVCHFLPLRR